MGEQLLQPFKELKFLFQHRYAGVILSALVTSATVQIMHTLVEERFGSGVIDLLPDNLFPVRNVAEQVADICRQISFHQFQQRGQIVRMLSERFDGGFENLTPLLILPDCAASDSLEQRPINSFPTLFDLLKHMSGNRSIKPQPVDNPLDGNFAKWQDVNCVVLGDEMGACRACSELLNESGPVGCRNRFAPEQLCEHGLLLESRCEQRRENQINLVILQGRQFVYKKRAELFALDPMRIRDVLRDLRGNNARSFEFGGQGLEQLRHRVSIERWMGAAKLGIRAALQTGASARCQRSQTLRLGSHMFAALYLLNAVRASHEDWNYLAIFILSIVAIVLDEILPGN